MNLLTALFGDDPYRTEMLELRERMDKATETIEVLRNNYHKEVEIAAEAEQKCAETVALLDEYKERLEKSERQAASYQQLIENLRSRIKDYQHRITDYQQLVNDYSAALNKAQNK